MKMKTIMILTAIGGVALASPVMAQTADQTGRYATQPLSENNVFWGMEREPQPSRAYGSSVYPAGQPLRDVGAAPGAVDVHAPPRILDCVHVAFPQCSGG
jgi:hypothetical protein